MRDINPVHVLTIIIQRMEKCADSLEGVRLTAYDMTVRELRLYAEMLKRARKYTCNNAAMCVDCE